MNDRLASRIRTYWPFLVAGVAGWLVARILEWTGVAVPEGFAAEVVGALAFGAVYEAGRWLESRTGAGRLKVIARGVGKWLLSLGLKTGEPTYPDKP